MDAANRARAKTTDRLYVATVTRTFGSAEQPHGESCIVSGPAGRWTPRRVVEVACAFVDWFKQSVVRPVCSDGKIATVATSSIAVDSNTFTDGRTVNPTKQRVVDDSDAC